MLVTRTGRRYLSQRNPCLLWSLQCRLASTNHRFSLTAKKKLFKASSHSTTPDSILSQPARTRFAPSPTGLIHLGSLRTALYNYLLAKSTGGEFLLRLEDTDQKRLVPGAEQNIYNSLKWAGLNWDEGPEVGGPYGPYRQSDRADIYSKYANELIKSDHAYRCFCSKDRLDKLRESAQKLHPPSMASYDRKCTHLTPEESEAKAQNESFTVRFKTPIEYPEFHDLLHGKLNLQTQINHQDIRYDDPVLVKSDGLPTYHLANVVDDHLMKITHVIRGEEWLPSTPKHIAMYSAFGWIPPHFVHIPLLTSASDKKLSKRSGDIGVLSLAEKGILPEAMVNFVALFGWSPHRDLQAGQHASEIFTLQDLVKLFSLDGLTKARLENPSEFEQICNQIYAAVQPLFELVSDIPDYRKSLEYTRNILQTIKQSVGSIEDYVARAQFLYVKPDLVSSGPATSYLAGANKEAIKPVLQFAMDSIPQGLEGNLDLSHEYCNRIVQEVAHDGLTKPKVFQALRYALTGGVSGIDIPTIFVLLGSEVSQTRLQAGLNEICK